jgi:3-hydroxyisobutyrate dehydrogenase
VDTVGFIGLGNMGAGMAANIQRAGFPLVVLDARAESMQPFAERGAAIATSPADVARRSDVVLTSLPGPAQVEAVVAGPDGILSGIRPGGVYIDLTTSRPSLIRELAPRFAALGAQAMDAPVSGGKAGAESGKLAIMVGGAAAAFERVRPILEAMGERVIRAGEVGAGSVAKLVHNTIYQGVRQAIAEGLTLGVKAGVEAEPLWECVRSGSVGSMALLHDRIPATVFRDEYTPRFALALAYKDLVLAHELAEEFAVPMPLSAVAESVAAEGMERGWGDLDTQVLFRLQEEAAGVDVRVPPR